MADDNIQQPLPAPGGRSEVEQFLRWGAGLVLILAAGWGFIFFVGYVAYRGGMPLDFQAALIIAAVLSFGFLLFLERGLWLSRFMGLRVGPHSAPLKEAAFLWLTGVPGLLFRSSD